jgi:nucleotide-binding universal stress UspA family protein
VSEIVWIHPYCLSRENPALRAHRGRPAIFVWDEEEMEREQWTLKRLVFIRECLAEMPVEIRDGDVEDTVRAFAKEHNASKIVTVADPSPRIRELVRRLDALALPPDPFVEIPGQVDLRRFARFWKRAEPILFPQ